MGAMDFTLNSAGSHAGLRAEERCGLTTCTQNAFGCSAATRLGWGSGSRKPILGFSYGQALAAKAKEMAVETDRMPGSRIFFFFFLKESHRDRMWNVREKLKDDSEVYSRSNRKPGTLALAAHPGHATRQGHTSLTSAPSTKTA